MPNNDMSGIELATSISKRGEIKDPIPKEELSNASFARVQGRLRYLANNKANPNSTEVHMLKATRNHLVDQVVDYDRETSFGGIFKVLTPRIDDVLQKADEEHHGYQRVVEDISGLSQVASSLEKSAAGVIEIEETTGEEKKIWDSKLDGIAAEYVNGLRRRAEYFYAHHQARLQKNPDLQKAWSEYAKNLQSRIEILNFGEKYHMEYINTLSPLMEEIVKKEIKTSAVTTTPPVSIPHTPTSQEQTEGENGEQWPTWLVPGGKNNPEYQEAPEFLKTEIRLLAQMPDFTINYQALKDAYDSINQAIKDREITFEEARFWKDRLSERMAMLQRREIETRGQSSSTGNQLTAEEIAKAFAMAQGEGSPEQQKKIYEEVEDGALVPIDMTLKVPYFLLIGANETEREQIEKDWKARASIWSLAAYKQKVVSYEQLTLKDNPEAASLSNETLKRGMSMQGSFEGAALYTAVISKKIDLVSIGIRVENPNYDERHDPLIHRGCDKRKDWKQENSYKFLRNVFDIKTDKQFTDFRKGMKMLLQSKGIPPDKAVIAERVAWNLIYASNVVEEFDSGYDSNGIFNGNVKDRIPNSAPTHFRNPATWMSMHPQERLMAKASSNEPIGQVGDWSVFVAKRRDGKFTKETLPHTTARNALRGIKVRLVDNANFSISEYNKKRKEENKLKPDKNNTISMFQVLETAGLDLLDPRYSLNPNQTRLSASAISWDQVANAPFSGYYIEDLNWANKLFAVIMKGGQQSGVNEADLSMIVNKFNLDRTTRENILKIYYGIKSNTYNLEYVGGNHKWAMLLPHFKRAHPNFFD